MLEKIVKVAVNFATLDEIAATTGSAHVATLIAESLQAMVRSQLRTAAAVLVTIGVIAGVSTGVLARVQQRSDVKNQPVEQRQPAPADRLLRFPTARALGIVYVQDTDELDFAPLQTKDPWHRLGEARGVVRVPAHGLIRLDLSQAALADLSPLDELAPDALGALA